MTQHVQRTAANPPSHPPATPPIPQPNFQKIQKICTKQTQFSTPNYNKIINIIKNTIGFAFGFHHSFHPTERGLIETIALAGARQDWDIRTSEAAYKHHGRNTLLLEKCRNEPDSPAHRPHRPTPGVIRWA
jgi:hypothetical protein